MALELLGLRRVVTAQPDGSGVIARMATGVCLVSGSGVSPRLRKSPHRTGRSGGRGD